MGEAETVNSSEQSQSSFVDSLPEYFSAEDVRSSLRLTKEGLFVAEAAVEKLVEAYQLWLKAATNSQDVKSFDKCRKRLFGPDTPDISYLLDGKICIPGFLMPGGVENPEKGSVPYYPGSLLESSTFLHPKDPLLSTLPHLHAEMDPKEGLLLTFEWKKKRLSVSSSVLKNFSQVAAGSESILDEFPAAGSSLRENILPCMKLLERAREVAPKQALLVPQQYVGNKKLSYLRFRGLVFIVDEKQKVLCCYELNGKNFSRFVRKELEAMKPESPKRERRDLRRRKKINKNQVDIPEQAVKGFSLSKENKRYLGNMHARGTDFKVHPRVFYEFLRKAPKSAKLRTSLGARYTVKDCMVRFSSLMRSSERAEEREVPRSLRGDSGKNQPPSFRKSGLWAFSIAPGRILIAVDELRPRGGENKKNTKRPSRSPRK